MKFSCRVSTLTKEYCEALPLIQEHANEIRFDEKGNIIHPDLDLNFYFSMEQANRAFVVILESDDKQMMGYMSVIVFNEPHYRTKLAGSIESFYIDKKYRDSMRSIKMLREMVKTVENTMKTRYNAQYVYFNFSDRKNLERIAERLGYGLAYYTFKKDI